MSLIISGALVPFLNDKNAQTGTIAILEVSSPVGFNDGSKCLDGLPPFGVPGTSGCAVTVDPPAVPMHVVFYNNTCTRVISRFIPETANDIGFLNITTDISLNGNGLAAVAASPQTNGFNLVPLDNAIHTKMYLFNVGNGQSRVLDPIGLDAFDFVTGNQVDPESYTGGATTWNPMRTGATFYAPLETAVVNTRLILVCPRNSIQGDTTNHQASTGAFPQRQPSLLNFAGGIASLNNYSGFPAINHPFVDGTPGLPNAFTLQGMSGVIYDDNEKHVGDFTTTCDCLTELSVNDLDGSTYPVPSKVPFGSYTEIFVTSNTAGSFTGYRQVFTVGAPINNFTSRLSNGNKTSIQGVVAGRAALRSGTLTINQFNFR